MENFYESTVSIEL